MPKKAFTAMIAGAALLLGTSQSMAASQTINLNSPTWLGALKLSSAQLKRIKEATEKALNAPIDAEQQCGEVRLDCVVRAAREWKVGDDLYREIVIHIHTVGHTSHAVSKVNGKWPKVTIK